MAAPLVPQLGIITTFSSGDGIGRIELADGTGLKVGVLGLKGIVSFDDEERPLIGRRVLVEEVAPHPLGGFRAMRCQPIGKEVLFTKVSSPAEWEKQLRTAGLSDSCARAIRTACRPAAGIAVKKSAAKPGASRIGGAPKVPLGFMWPTVDGTPLLFLLQIALTDLPSSVRHDLGLEAKGSLAIFIHPDAADGNETCIVMPIAALSRAPIASPGRAIAFSEIWTPPPPSLLFEQRFDQRIYEAAFANHARAQKKALHQIGGHPNAVQDSPENHGERLLLQLDTEDDAELMWNDAGRLYVLVGRDLTDARCEIQST